MLLQDKEAANGGSAPRILNLDDYFMVEVERLVTDEDSGRKMKRKVSIQMHHDILYGYIVS